MNVAILGAGYIAQKMAKTLNAMEKAEAYAIGSRDYQKAKTFADTHKVQMAYGSYDEIVKDPKVDLVYISTPTVLHAEHMKLCLENGKPVLCEKTFTLNAVQAKEVIELGKKKNLLVAEAIWTRYLPMRGVLDKILAEGIIGNPTSLIVNLNHINYKKEAHTRLDSGGGAMVDVGVYTINFALMAFGNEIEKIDTSVIKYKTGVDAMSSTTFCYKDGKMAILHSSIMSRSDRRGMIFGDAGYLEVVNINNCEAILVYNVTHELIKTYERPNQITGFEYQVESCRKALEEGKVECPEMPHSEIIRVMTIMDHLRISWGIKYPIDSTTSP
jgi:predicted dehydrogenase